MLSRFAHNLYWLGRYLERAENTARLLDVNYFAVAENLVEGDWEQLLNMSGNPETFAQHYPQADGQTVTQWLAFDLNNPGCLRNSLRAARENARTVRYYLNLEIFEELNQAYNQLFFGVESGVAEEALHDYLVEIRRAAHQVWGIAEATLPRDEAHLFLRTGRYLERMDNGMRILQAYLAEGQPQEPLSRAFLRSVGALEAFRKSGAPFDPQPISHFLLRDAQFPRSALYCARMLHEALERLQEWNQADPAPTEQAGWLRARLRYGPINPVTFDCEAWLEEIAQLSLSVHSTYFEARQILPLQPHQSQ